MKYVYLCLMALALSACAPEPPTKLLSSTDPSIGLRPQFHVRVNADARHYEAVEPLEWVALNRRVGPKEK